MNTAVTTYKDSATVTSFLQKIGDNSKSKTAAEKFFTWLDSIIGNLNLTGDQKQEVYNKGINYLQAIFLAKQARKTEPSKEVINSAEELKIALQTDRGQVSEQGKILAEAIDQDQLEFLGKQGPIIAACLASTEDLNLMKLIDASINPEAFSGNGVQLNEDSLKQLVSGIQGLYQVSTELETKFGTDPRVAIQAKLVELGLSKEQASQLKAFMQEAIKQHEAGAASDPSNDWIKGLTKNLANEKGIMAIGTVVFMFGGLLTNIPFIGPMIAPLVEASKSLLGAMQGLVPIMLMARSNPPQPVQPVQESREPSPTQQAAVNSTAS